MPELSLGAEIGETGKRGVYPLRRIEVGRQRRRYYFIWRYCQDFEFHLGGLPHEPGAHEPSTTSGPKSQRKNGSSVSPVYDGLAPNLARRALSVRCKSHFGRSPNPIEVRGK